MDARKPDREPLDLTVIEESEALLPFMTASQKVDFYKLETAIDDAESDLRSGQHLANSKPSNLDPDKDLKPIIKRGEELILKSEEAIYQNQKVMIDLLETVKVQEAEQTALDLIRYNYDLASASLEQAIAEQSKALIEDCWAKGYETLFFDGVFLVNENGTEPANAEIRNQFYDELVKIDGTTFSVTIPVGFSLKSGTTGLESNVFDYENAAVFKEDQKALLLIEIILPESSSTGLLSLQAIDLKSQKTVSSHIIKLSDAAEVFAIEAESLEDIIPKRVEMLDSDRTIDLLTQLPTPYAFEIQSPEGDWISNRLLANTLLNNSDLQLVDSESIKRIYGANLEDPDKWVGKANAALLIQETSDENSFDIVAKANGSDRELSAGRLVLVAATMPEVIAPVETQ